MKKISVITTFNSETGLVIPKNPLENRDYLIKKILLIITKFAKENIIHVFHVTDGNLDFRHL